MIPGLDVAAALGGLKDFQRRTVDYVFRRMFEDEDPAYRFLVADEVGLGKTMVARGIIARAMERIESIGDDRRIDIVYVCSNATIARQNINRLNVLGKRQFGFSSRLTMLPTQVHELDANRVNFVSFTPSTTFDLRSRGGIAPERALILQMLLRGGIGRRTPLLNAFQCGASLENFRKLADDRSVQIDEGITEGFLSGIRAEPSFLDRIDEMCERFQRNKRHYGHESSVFRYEVIGDLRRKLAHICVNALEPDLVVLDEFQRFKELLTPDTEAGQLAETLMSHTTPEGERVRVLLLSATPYRSYTMHHEAEEDHYRDFLQTASFLFDSAQKAEALDSALKSYRAALLAVEEAGDFQELGAARNRVEQCLLSVMCRTERVAQTDQFDAMLTTHLVPSPLEAGDLGQARLVDEVATALGSQDPIEYWKSAPYLLQFMKDYQMKRKLVDEAAHPLPTIADAIRSHRAHTIERESVEDYRSIASSNGRLRGFLADVVDGGSWKLLWVPPALPYLEPSGGYAEASNFTKALIFSSWTVVPDTIAALVSYEAERRMVEEEVGRPGYFELTRRRRGLLRFSVDADGRPTAMNALGALFPSPALADVVDPLELAANHGAPVAPDAARLTASAAIRMRLESAGQWPPTISDGQIDSRWYWVGLVLLERGDEEVLHLCRRSWASAISGEVEDVGEGLAEHIQQFSAALEGGDFSLVTLGRPPEDLFEVLADIALGSPAICAFRSLRRLCPDLSTPALMSAAARIAEGFRSLYNVPESMGLLRAADPDAYWHAVVRYGIDGNLQAVLDEYAHVLREWLGLHGHPDTEAAEGIASAMEEALSLRTARVEADAIEVTPADRVSFERFSFRCRYALRFSELRDDDGKALARLDTVRKAFNSPFRPFVLASTSVGQEGLDFHPYCHRVYHWNLPRNPVDMEQREGRVHRFKGHAIRRNVARKIGLGAIRSNGHADADPWITLFERASEERNEGRTELFPYWVYPLEGGATIERRVPMLPLSREYGRFEKLKRSLALYRMVFGQPRQEDLLAHLARTIDDPERIEQISRLQICLEPPQ